MIGVESSPGLPIPAGATDSHAHVIGDGIEHSFVAQRDYTPTPATVEEYVSVLRSLRVDRAVLVQPSVYGLDNTVLVEAMRAMPLPTRGVIMCDSTISRAELEDLDALGVRGVRFVTALRGGAPISELPAVARKIADFGWHLQVWAPPEDWIPLVDGTPRLPVPLVIDHLGHLPMNAVREQADYADRDMLTRTERALGDGRMWLKAIGYRASQQGRPHDDALTLVRRLRSSFPERLLWGTDWPHVNFDPQPRTADLTSAWMTGATSSELQQIMVDNPAELYRFER